DEFIDRGSFRLARYGTRSAAREDDSGAVATANKSSTWGCIWVPQRRTLRIKLTALEDWCIDYSIAGKPVLWIISKYAWYKVAGGSWWDKVQSAPHYASTFTPTERKFRLMSLVMRALTANPNLTLSQVARRADAGTSGELTIQDLVQHHSFILGQLEGLVPFVVTTQAGATQEVYPPDSQFAIGLAEAGNDWESAGATATITPAELLSLVEQREQRKEPKKDQKAPVKREHLSALPPDSELVKEVRAKAESQALKVKAAAA
ncbi:unnamed protein product, partial [Chrysoparadoxa australica]